MLLLWTNITLFQGHRPSYRTQRTQYFNLVFFSMIRNRQITLDDAVTLRGEGGVSVCLRNNREVELSHNETAGTASLRTGSLLLPPSNREHRLIPPQNRSESDATERFTYPERFYPKWSRSVGSRGSALRLLPATMKTTAHDNVSQSNLPSYEKPGRFRWVTVER